MKVRPVRLALSMLLLAALTIPPLSGTSASAGELLWSDEFDAAAGTAPNGAIWNHDRGGLGWGNNELQCYTNSTANSAHTGTGQLAITARATGRKGVQCYDSKTNSYSKNYYTSARLTTKGKMTQQYGSIEMRAKLPRGQGIWPAFWALGSNYPETDWPYSGEIDVMENIGSDMWRSHANIHGPDGNGGWSTYNLPSTYNSPVDLSLDYHVYKVYWLQDSISFYVDGNWIGTKTPADLPTGSTWAFNHPFFLLLNVAVGGNWPGAPNKTTTFPQTMLVDWIRAYAP